MSRTALALASFLAWAGATVIAQTPSAPAPGNFTLNLTEPSPRAANAHPTPAITMTPPGPTSLFTPEVSMWPTASHNGCRNMWFHADLLVWGVKDGPLNEPLLISRTHPPGNLPALGKDEARFGVFAGSRVVLGTWLGESHPWLGVEVSGLVLAKNTWEKGALSDTLGSPELYRPLINAATGDPFALDVSVPRAFNGRLDVKASSFLWGGAVDVCTTPAEWKGCQLQALGGYRHLGLNEGLEIAQISQLIRPEPITTSAFGLVGSLPRFRVVDNFRCLNYFNGGEAGLRVVVPCGPSWFSLASKCALGVTSQNLRIDGNTVGISAGDGSTFVAPGGRAQAGILAGPSNIGTHERTRFSVVGEAELEWGVSLCSWLDFSLGYTFLWWDGVLRPGDQIDRRVNVDAIPLAPVFNGNATSPALPTVPFKERDFWAQGLTLSMKIQF